MLSEAEQRAEEVATQVQGKVFHRRDIGTAVLVQKRINHMKSLLVTPLT